MKNITQIKKDFPILQQTTRSAHSLVYLDNAATTQKPKAVIAAIQNYYQTSNANIHRGAYTLAQKATNAYEAARTNVQQFIHATSREEIIFTKGTTEAINLVANTYAEEHLKENDNIVITAMEHHSNLIPWQILAKRKKAQLRIIPIDVNGMLQLDQLDDLLDQRTCLVALVHISNSLGTINPVETIIEKAHQKNIPVLLDGAQSTPHQAIDVQALDCDFFCFSGHKIFGPTGIGILYGKQSFLEKMQPYQFGGEMIKSVSFEHTNYHDLPHKFEAGTPNIAGAVGLGAALDYVNEIGMKEIENYTTSLLHYATDRLSSINGLKIIGQAKQKASIVSFVLDEVHPHDIATILNESGVAVRAGHHCTQPVMQFFKIPGTVRASFTIYNTKEDVDRLVDALLTVKEIFC